jgi:hypothetical protein
MWESLSNFVVGFYRLVTHPDLGSFASLVGAMLSAYVLKSVSEIRKRVLLKLRAPDVINDLSTSATTISNLMHDFDANLQSIDEKIALAHETLKNVVPKITGEPRKTVKLAIKDVSRYRSLSQQAKTREVVWKIYVHLLVSMKAIENLIADYHEEP